MWRITEEFLRRQAARVSTSQLDGLLGRLVPLFRIIIDQASLSRFRDDARTLASMIRDYRAGTYARVPYWAVAAAGFALLYVLNPLDILPDVIPFMGYVDDAAVLAKTLALIRKELDAYRAWKGSLGGEIIDVEVIRADTEAAKGGNHG